jgi:hypothetical protein
MINCVLTKIIYTSCLYSLYLEKHTFQTTSASIQVANVILLMCREAPSNCMTLGQHKLKFVCLPSRNWRSRFLSHFFSENDTTLWVLITDRIVLTHKIFHIHAHLSYIKYGMFWAHVHEVIVCWATERLTPFIQHPVYACNFSGFFWKWFF